MALDDDVEYLPAVILPVIEGYGDPVIKRVLNAYTGSIDPLALMAAIEDAVIERADKKVMFGSDQLVEKLRARRSGERAMFDASDTTAPQSSADIKTLEDAKNYWNTYFLSRKRLVQVRHNNRQYDLKIDFLTDHAYTKKNPNGNDPERVLDLSRAQALDNIWKVLNAPDAITWSETTPTNKQYDSELSVVDKLYGRVILRPKPTAQDKANNECTHFVLVSWHLPSESQHKKALVRTYGERTTPISLPKKQRA